MIRKFCNKNKKEFIIVIIRNYKFDKKLIKDEKLDNINSIAEFVADALGDMMYILCGTILSHGLQDKIEHVFEEIQKSNMSKLDRNGKPIYREDGKILKSSNYFKPNISKIFIYLPFSL